MHLTKSALVLAASLIFAAGSAAQTIQINCEEATVYAVFAIE